MRSVRVCALLISSLAAAILPVHAQTEATLAGIGSGGFEWRHIGPAAFGGRIEDVDASPASPGTIFVAAASGGIFKTTNNGVTWKPVFDRDGQALSVGDVTIAPSDPNIVWRAPARRTTAKVQALRAVTLAPAEVFGVADSVGSLAPGKEANIVIWDGDPFEFARRGERVFLRGLEVAAPSRQDALTERYKIPARK